MIQDFKNADGIELNIGDSISGVNHRGELVQGMLSTFHDIAVILEDFDNMLHSLEFKDVKIGHVEHVDEVISKPIVKVVKGHGEYLITNIKGDYIICRTFDGDAKALRWANKIAKALNRKKV